MANYYAACRTNYFNVKDPEAFEKAMENVPSIELVGEGDKYCILGNDPDGSGWPAFIWDEETEDEIEIDLHAMVAEHLQDDEVAIFMEAGAEKLRYVTGYAIAVNNKGETRSVSLQNIYDLAEELTNRPDDITSAEY